MICNTVHGRRHTKIFKDFHVSWDTLYHPFNFQGEWDSVVFNTPENSKTERGGEKFVDPEK